MASATATAIGTKIAQSIMSPLAPPANQATIINQWISITDLILQAVQTGIITVPVIPVATSSGAGATTAPVTAPITFL